MRAHAFQAIDYHVAAQNVQHVIIDNLQFMLGNTGSYSDEQQMMAQEAVFSEFRRLATSKNIHITMVIHPRKVGCIKNWSIADR